MNDATQIWQMSATQQAQSLKQGRISSREAVQTGLDRMDAVNPALNAVVVPLAEMALARADQLDAVPPEDRGPLHGLPITIKINADQAQEVTSNGVVAFDKLVAPDDAPFVTNLLNAGAVVLGRTNTPEFSFRVDCDNPLYGRTYNPWGAHISAGGSSGGAGSAVMAGIGALAHGNDILGSLRFPAAANGAVTVKPSLYRVPAWNPSQTAERGLVAQLMSVQGLLTRSAADLHLGMPVMIQPDARDPFHAPLPWNGPALDGLPKVGFTKAMYDFSLHPEMEAALDDARTALEDAGYEVVEIDPPNAQDIAALAVGVLMGEVEALLRADITKFGSDAIQTAFDFYYRAHPPLEGNALLAGMAKRTHYARQWSIQLQETPIVLTPFMPVPFPGPNRDLESFEGSLEIFGGSIWSFVMNFLGLPAGSVPARLAHLPTGPQPLNVQIVGQRWREDLVVDAMTAIEDRAGQMCHHLWDKMG